MTGRRPPPAGSARKVTAHMLNKVVDQIVRREVALAGYDDTLAINRITRTEDMPDGANWKVRIISCAAAKPLVQKLVEDLRSKYVLSN